jgi:sporulation protein YlmC with PRC-barrel domain
MKLFASFFVCGLLGAWSGLAAAEPVVTQKVVVAKSFPASKLEGLNVRNEAGEKLGVVHDTVINVETGKVAYVALSHGGGVLGVGSKLFAVPFNQIKFVHGKDEMWFVLNIQKEKLEAAPGFDNNAWPDFADEKWIQQIDTYYREATIQDKTRVRAE